MSSRLPSHSNTPNYAHLSQILSLQYPTISTTTTTTTTRTNASSTTTRTTTETKTSESPTIGTPLISKLSTSAGVHHHYAATAENAAASSPSAASAADDHSMSPGTTKTTRTTTGPHASSSSISLDPALLPLLFRLELSLKYQLDEINSLIRNAFENFTSFYQKATDGYELKIREEVYQLGINWGFAAERCMETVYNYIMQDFEETFPSQIIASVTLIADQFVLEFNSLAKRGLNAVLQFIPFGQSMLDWIKFRYQHPRLARKHPDQLRRMYIRKEIHRLRATYKKTPYVMWLSSVLLAGSLLFFAASLYFLLYIVFDISLYNGFTFLLRKCGYVLMILLSILHGWIIFEMREDRKKRKVANQESQVAPKEGIFSPPATTMSEAKSSPGPGAVKGVPLRTGFMQNRVAAMGGALSQPASVVASPLHVHSQRNLSPGISVTVGNRDSIMMSEKSTLGSGPVASHFHNSQESPSSSQQLAELDEDTVPPFLLYPVRSNSRLREMQLSYWKKRGVSLEDLGLKDVSPSSNSNSKQNMHDDSATQTKKEIMPSSLTTLTTSPADLGPLSTLEKQKRNQPKFLFAIIGATQFLIGSFCIDSMQSLLPQDSPYFSVYHYFVPLFVMAFISLLSFIVCSLRVVDYFKAALYVVREFYQFTAFPSIQEAWKIRRKKEEQQLEEAYAASLGWGYGVSDGRLSTSGSYSLFTDKRSAQGESPHTAHSLPQRLTRAHTTVNRRNPSLHINTTIPRNISFERSNSGVVLSGHSSSRDEVDGPFVTPETGVSRLRPKDLLS